MNIFIAFAPERWRINSIAPAKPHSRFLRGQMPWILKAGVCLLLAGQARAGEAVTNSLSAATDLSLEQLMNIKVTILGQSQTVSKTPAAVSVVTQDDIQRSGAQNIPEALRLVPGMDVAQLNANGWTVSARGFNDEFANKLLVLQDGRSLYTPLFGGVYWDVQGTMMEDIDQIEVVRGPGATLWGANAMNGVINIITKSAADTQGLLVTSGGGTLGEEFGARYGGKISDNAYYRVYGTYENQDNLTLPDGNAAYDASQTARGGFRTDWNPPGDNLFTFQGDGYQGDIHDAITIYDASSPTLSSVAYDNIMASGANALGRWTHTVSDTADFKLQAYYDYTERNAAQVSDSQCQTFDLNFQNEFAVGDRNKLIWGLGYRLTADTEKNSPTVQFNPASDTLNLYSGFVQDEIALVPDRLALTLGTKLEHNDYTGLEVEPGARLAWTPAERYTFWAAVSRAVRTPARADEALTYVQTAPTPPFPPGTPLVNMGSTAFDSEEMLAYEIGCRAAPWEKVSFDVAAFYNDYNHLSSVEIVSPYPPVVVQANKIYGDTYGTEVSATWRVTDRLRLQPAATFLKMNLHARSDSTDTTTVPMTEGESPEMQFSIRSSLDLPNNVTFDTAWRYVDSLPSLQVPSYFEMDARLAWRINQHWELALIGQNLLQSQHLEFAATTIKVQQAEIPRSVMAKITWRF
jgi:iron complex outermembrane receptor protein